MRARAGANSLLNNTLARRARADRFALAEATVARASDFGRNDTTYFVRTHLGHVLHPGRWRALAFLTARLCCTAKFQRQAQRVAFVVLCEQSAAEAGACVDPQGRPADEAKRNSLLLTLTSAGDANVLYVWTSDGCIPEGSQTRHTCFKVIPPPNTHTTHTRRHPPLATPAANARQATWCGATTWPTQTLSDSTLRRTSTGAPVCVCARVLCACVGATEKPHPTHIHSCTHPDDTRPPSPPRCLPGAAPCPTRCWCARATRRSGAAAGATRACGSSSGLTWRSTTRGEGGAMERLNLLT